MIGRAWEVGKKECCLDDRSCPILRSVHGTMSTVIRSTGWLCYVAMNRSGMSETMNADDFCAFMMPYFSPMAFFGFGDDENGFYSVFSKVFSEILTKERYGL